MKKKQIRIFFIFLILPVGLLFGGNTGKLTGTITDVETGLPLPGVNVFIVGSTMGAVTDLDGDYTILFVPPGIHDVKATFIGYTAIVTKDVTVVVDLTTRVDFEMKSEVIIGEEVTVTAKRPIIQRDLTSSRTTVTAETLADIPLEDITDVLNLSAGFVDGHARGGRSGEILFLINGIPALDPMFNSYDTDVPEFALAEADIITSGFSAEYSNALSGVVNLITQEGGPSIKGNFRIRSNDSNLLGVNLPGKHQTRNIEGSLGGPLFNLPVRWFVSGELLQTQGRYGIRDQESITLNGSISLRPFPKTKLRFVVNTTMNVYDSYSHRYSRTTYENEDSDGDGYLDRVIVLASKDILDESLYNPGGILYGITMEQALAAVGLDKNNLQKKFVRIEMDIDGAGSIRWPGDGDYYNEDLNGNSIWDISDFNRNGASTDSSFIDVNGDGKYQWGIDQPTQNLAVGEPDITEEGYTIVAANRNLPSGLSINGFDDEFNMLDHLLRNREKTSHLSFILNHQFAKNTFFHASVSQYRTSYRYDTHESKEIPAYINFLKENGITDQKLINKYGNNLFTDWNNNDFLDISEDAFPSNPDQWLAWETIPIQNDQDIDKFYTYGSGTTFYRLRWNEDEKVIWNLKSSITSQLTKYHLIKTGFELNLYDIFDHDVDMPSGGNIYGQNIGSNYDWGRAGESFDDTGIEGISGTAGNGIWDHLDYGEDGVPAVDGNGDGDYDDDFFDFPPDKGEGDGKVNYDELAEPWDDLYKDLSQGAAQEGINPIWWGIFIQDKMEFKSLIVNAGLRMDYFDPKYDNYPSNIDDPVVDRTVGGKVKNPISVDAKFYWSPRLGIAFPITDRDVFYFNYGRTFQIPQFRRLFNNTNYDFSGAFPIVGNANILPETTTSYEIGIRHQIGLNWRLEAKGFYKDIQGLTDTKKVDISASQYYTTTINGDYGNVRGFEINLFKQFSSNFGGDINYTFAIAKGKSSSAVQNYRYTWASLVIPRSESYLDWDQRHTINANLKVRIPIIGVDLNSTLQYGSGLPYSPARKSLDPEINTKRRPGTFHVNLYVDKDIPLPMLGEHVTFSVILWIDNLFNTKNILGIADEEWFDIYYGIQKRYEKKDAVFFGSEDDNNGLDDDGDGYVDETLKEEYMMLMDVDGNGKIDYNKKYPAAGSFGDPGYYAEGRLIKLGISLNF